MTFIAGQKARLGVTGQAPPFPSAVKGTQTTDCLRQVGGSVKHLETSTRHFTEARDGINGTSTGVPVTVVRVVGATAAYTSHQH